MNDNSMLPSGSSQSSYTTTSGHSSTPLLDKIIEHSPTKQLEYLRGKEGAISSLLQWGFLAGIVAWVLTHLDVINAALDGLIEAWMKLAVLLGFAAVSLLVYKVLGAKEVRDGLNNLIDKRLFAIARWLRTRGDKILNCRFNISRLEKRKNEADTARAKVEGVSSKFTQAVEHSKRETQESFSKVQAFDEEIQRRSRGGKDRPKFSELADLSDDQLERYRNRAESEMRVSNDAFKEQSKERDDLLKKCAFLRDLSDALDNKVGELKYKLNKAIEKNQLSKDKATAMEAYSEVSGGQEVEDFNQTMGDIERETEFYNGFAQILMDRLDPTVQQFKMGKVADVVTADQLYREFAAKVGNMRPEISQELLTPAKSVIPEIERYLGNPVPSPVSSPIRPTHQNRPDEDELLK